MGTQKNRLNEMFFGHPKYMLKFMDKELFTSFANFFVYLNLCLLLGFVLILYGCEAQGCCRFARLFVDLYTYLSIDL